ncbi:MAG: hypothetical protein K5756_04810 [Clostridiales bacterium]|nr:hypothetical protein [Clostridiales bacterium]
MRKLYGRINEEGVFEMAPRTLDLDGYIIINPLEVHYQRAGYKPVEESNDIGTAVYTDVGDRIIQSRSGSPDEEYEDKITALELAVCEIYEYIERMSNDGKDIL